jgi:gamma-glutamyltranspeptidase/glutathione hydrolase
MMAAMAAQADFRAALGFVGDFMQPQGQNQVLPRILDEGYDPQAALDAPRLRLETDGQIALEVGLERTEEALGAQA